MPKVTKELIKTYIDAGALPPRHQRGCPKNAARMDILAYVAKGLPIEETKSKIRATYNSLPCKCE